MRFGSWLTPFRKRNKRLGAYFSGNCVYLTERDRDFRFGEIWLLAHAVRRQSKRLGADFSGNCNCLTKRNSDFRFVEVWLLAHAFRRRSKRLGAYSLEIANVLQKGNCEVHTLLMSRVSAGGGYPNKNCCAVIMVSNAFNASMLLCKCLSIFCCEAALSDGKTLCLCAIKTCG